MRINAYVLAADPTWLPESVRAYYRHVEKLVVSYDVDGRGWAGGRVHASECVAALRALDVDGKIEWAPGRFAAAAGSDPVAADTRQRSEALALAAAGADWVLQIDTDELLPRWGALAAGLEEAEAQGLAALEWPMRVLFRRLSNGRYLEVATAARTTHYEYPGPIAVRPGVELVEARRVSCDYLRPIVIGDVFSLQVQRSPVPGEHRIELVNGEDAIVHNSWARPPAVVREKIRSWSHNQGMKSWLYYYTTWLPAPLTWHTLRRIHPLHPPLWPRLQLSSGIEA